MRLSIKEVLFYQPEPEAEEDDEPKSDSKDPFSAFPKG